MSSWCRTTGYSLTVTFVATIAAAYLYRDKLNFVATCYANGNSYRSCSCTFSALPKLSSNYRDLAQSWAADPSGVYARSILYAAAKETLKATTGISKDLLDKDASAKSYGTWLKTATNAVGWPQTKKVIEGTAQVIATAGAAKTIIVPVVLAGTDLQGARSAMNQLCGGTPHFLTPIDRISESLASAARDSSKWVLDQAGTAGGVASDAVVASGNAVVTAAR